MSRTGDAPTARGPELAALEHELELAGTDGSRLVLVSGPPGVGRTALVDALLVRHGGGALRARAVAWERERSFAVMHQLLGVAVTDDPLDAADALAEQVRGATDGPTLVVVDDAHWADEASLRSLDSAVRHHPDARVLVVLTSSTDAPAATLHLLRRGAATDLRLGALSSAAVGEVAAARGVHLHPSMVDRLWAHTGGVVAHVVALLDEVPRTTWSAYDPRLPAPAAVAARVRETLTGCTPEARNLTEAVAVLGGPSACGEVAELAGVTEDVVAPLAEARSAGLVATGPHGPTELRPVDPMVRAAVLDAMGPASAAALARRAAETVSDPVQRLCLLVSASPLPDAALADELDEAAAERAGAGAWAESASLLLDAARITDDRLLREQRLTRAVDALVGAGDAHGAAALAPELESLRETALRNAVLGYLAVVRGRVTEAESRLGRAWDLVNSEREPEVAALIAQRYVLHALARLQGEELLSWAARAAALVDEDHPAAVEAAAIRGLGLAATGRAEEALAAYRDLSGRQLHGAQVQRVAMGRGWLDLALDALEDARADLESAVPTTYLGGSARISLWARAWLARAQFLTGDWDGALRTVQEGEPLLERTGILLAGPLLRWSAVQVHALRGDWELAEAELRRIDASPQEYEIMRVPAYLARAHLAEARADYAAVLRALRPLTARWARAVDEPGQWPWADMYANALVLEGHLDETESFLAEHEARARSRGHRSTRARLGYARGRLLGARGDLPAARAAFEESLALLDDLPLRYDRARVNFAYGQTLRRAGRRREADAVISTARDLFAALGASTYVARCDRELKAGGVRSGDRSGGSGEGRARSERDDLTPQEEAVTALVASGMSNREVAAELFLSAKTVQYHLTRVYAKLGVRSRSELAALRAPRSDDPASGGDAV